MSACLAGTTSRSCRSRRRLGSGTVSVFCNCSSRNFVWVRSYVRTCSEALSIASRAHLKTLYDDLLAPVRDRLHARHLIVVPHRIPALLAVSRALRWRTVPRGRVLVLLYAERQPSLPAPDEARHAGHRRSLVLGVPDRAAPQIRNEVRAVAAAASRRPRVRRPEGERAAVAGAGPTSRIVHIATHGRFRQDNPMFSSIAAGNVSAQAVRPVRARLSSELVTLSGCGTGLNVVIGGDELVGLVRGGSMPALGRCWRRSGT